MNGAVAWTCVLLALWCTAASAAGPTPRMYYGDPTGRDTKDPSVVRFKGQYFLYYSLAGEKDGENGGGWTIAVATSENLRDWTFAGRLTAETEAEQKGFCAPGARVIDGRVHLFYQSYGGGAKDAILHAVSDDGLTFQRTPGGHVFRPSGNWTNGRAIDAEVYPVGDKLMLYYASRDPSGRVQIVGAASAPLKSDYSKTQWTQLTQSLDEVLRPTVPLPLDAKGIQIAWEEECIEAPTLLEHDGRHYLFYAGAYNNRPQQIGVCVSDDGVNFRRLNDGRPILTPGPAGSWNAAESGHPGTFKDDDGRCYLFYQGDNPKTGVKWHLSMCPIRWQKDPAGGPDLPVLQHETK